jgi:hypothetical protein
MTLNTFPRVELSGVKRLPCTGCGQQVTRKTTVHQTLNPFNKNADGSLKTRDRILFELRKQLDLWHALPTRHVKCIDS